MDSSEDDRWEEGLNGWCPSGYWQLVGDAPQGCGLGTWARVYKEGRPVVKTIVAGWTVHTQFIWSDLGFEGKPLLFESATYSPNGTPRDV